MPRKLRICVCTPYRADAEPRGPRHARALAELRPDCEVTFLDCSPLNFKRIPTPVLGDLPNLQWLSHAYPTKTSGLLKLVRNKLSSHLAQLIFQATGKLLPALFSPNVVGLTQRLRTLQPDVIHAHNTEMLLPAMLALPKGGQLIFDCMEFYSDMGEGQASTLRVAIRKLESQGLPQCALLTTSSPQVSAAYQQAYGCTQFLSLYNCPSQLAELTLSPPAPIKLYWRNSVLGVSQRGLAEALDALVDLPEEITLHLQGRLGFDNGVRLKAEIAQRRLEHRVHILPPHAPDQAVLAAAGHTIGLCLERDGNRNHELTVSNKMFDYMMAGLAVLSSDLPGLHEVVTKSQAGLLFTPGSAASLKAQIIHLNDNPALLQQLRTNARIYALQEGNRETQMDRFKIHLSTLLPFP